MSRASPGASILERSEGSDCVRTGVVVCTQVYDEIKGAMSRDQEDKMEMTENETGCLTPAPSTLIPTPSLIPNPAQYPLNLNPKTHTHSLPLALASPPPAPPLTRPDDPRRPDAPSRGA